MNRATGGLKYWLSSSASFALNCTLKNNLNVYTPYLHSMVLVGWRLKFLLLIHSLSESNYLFELKSTWGAEQLRLRLNANWTPIVHHIKAGILARSREVWNTEDDKTLLLWFSCSKKRINAIERNVDLYFPFLSCCPFSGSLCLFSFWGSEQEKNKPLHIQAFLHSPHISVFNPFLSVELLIPEAQPTSLIKWSWLFTCWTMNNKKN